MNHSGYKGQEKRKFLRVRLPCRIAIFNFPERSISAHTENISAGGVRVIMEERMEMGSTVGLEIHLNEKLISCKGKIVWVVDKKSHFKKNVCYYDTGIEFCEITDQDRFYINSAIEKIVDSRE